MLRSRWLWFCVGTYLALSGVFVLVGLRESSVLGFTGMGRVLMSFSHALVLLSLLGLSASGQVINRMRDEGSLELWFSHPVTRGSFFVAVSLVRFAVLVAPLVVILPLLGLIGESRVRPGGALGGLVLRTVLVSAALLAVAVALGLLVSTFVRNQSKALMLLLLIWALGVALLDFALVGPMLQGHVQPLLVFVLAALNPVQDARLALISGANAELGQLGPVGFFLAQRLGPAGLLAIGIAWPLTLAASAWLVTLQRFRRADLV